MGVETFVGVVIAAFGGVEQHKSAKLQRRAVAEQAKTQKAERRIAEIRNQRARSAQLRKARALRAREIAKGVGAGVAPTTSTVEGGVSSIGTQAAGTIGFLNRAEGLGTQISGFNIAASSQLQQASEAQGRATTFRTIGGLASTIFSDAGGFQNTFSETN